MKVLIACEYSGIVRDAFIKKGHDAISCDILPTESQGPHIQDDILNHLNEKWELMIAHPPCTHLSVAGANLWKEKQADGRQQQAFEFIKALWNAPIPKICIENPTGWLNTNWKKPAQRIDPFMFGDPYLKGICLWLKGLPPLYAYNYVKPIAKWVSAGSAYRGRGRLKGLKHNAHESSKFFPGVAEAMAEQWGI